MSDMDAENYKLLRELVAEKERKKRLNKERQQRFRANQAARQAANNNNNNDNNQGGAAAGVPRHPQAATARTRSNNNNNNNNNIGAAAGAGTMLPHSQQQQPPYSQQHYGAATIPPQPQQPVDYYRAATMPSQPPHYWHQHPTQPVDYYGAAVPPHQQQSWQPGPAYAQYQYSHFSTTPTTASNYAFGFPQGVSARVESMDKVPAITVLACRPPSTSVLNCAASGATLALDDDSAVDRPSSVTKEASLTEEGTTSMRLAVSCSTSDENAMTVQSAVPPPVPPRQPERGDTSNHDDSVISDNKEEEEQQENPSIAEGDEVVEEDASLIRVSDDVTGSPITSPPGEATAAVVHAMGEDGRDAEEAATTLQASDEVRRQPYVGIAQFVHHNSNPISLLLLPFFNDRIVSYRTATTRAHRPIKRSSTKRPWQPR
jgi:hypothetical protein